jgi:hypothetical protein
MEVFLSVEMNIRIHVRSDIEHYRKSVKFTVPEGISTLSPNAGNV